jgi:hypothetical protein
MRARLKMTNDLSGICRTLVIGLCYISPLPSDFQGKSKMFKTSIFGTINGTLIFHFNQLLKEEPARTKRTDSRE